tara:strand:+ start:23 stop:928 length:906 start_codon:yes stop_codon:yes gene_type:complete
MKAGIHADRKELWLDNTALDEFRKCPASFNYRMNAGLVEVGDEFNARDPGEPRPIASPLLFGLAIHAALDVLYTVGPGDAIDKFLEAYSPVPDDPKRTPDRGIKIITDYQEQWRIRNDSYDSVLCEMSYRAEIGKVTDQYGDEWTVIYTGLVDKILWEEASKPPVVMDHKTTTWNTQAMAQSYELANQFKGYMLLARRNGMQVPHLVLDLILIWPKNNEFQRYNIRMSDEQESDFIEQILHTCQMMLHCHHSTVWPEYGHSACTKFRSLCDYFHLCQAPKNRRAGIKSTFYEIDEWEALRN